MTEQEKLEKDIESVLKDRSNCDEYCFTHRRPWACEPCQVKRVTDYFIRKEADIRKETKKEIFKALDEIVDKCEKVDDILLYGKNFSKTGIVHRRFYVYKKDIQTLKEKFGVEVEE